MLYPLQNGCKYFPDKIRLHIVYLTMEMLCYGNVFICPFSRVVTINVNFIIIIIIIIISIAVVITNSIVNF